MKQINLSNLDLQLCDLTANNENQEGLLDTLEMILSEIIDPIYRTSTPNHEQRAMIVYSVLRNKKAIRALVSCLNQNVKKQSNDLNTLYSQCFKSPNDKKGGAN